MSSPQGRRDGDDHGDGQHTEYAAGRRIAIYTTSTELRGTVAAPEPLASRSHFYENDELVALADTAGFDNIAVGDHDGGQLLTAHD